MSENITISYTLKGQTNVEVHKKGEDFALYNPVTKKYITQFGEYTNFGPYVCDCIAVRDKQSGSWGIITLEGEIVLYPAYDYVDYPFTIEKVSFVDMNTGRDGFQYKRVYQIKQGLLNYGDYDIALTGIHQFDCNLHKSLEPKIESLEDIDFLKGFFEGIDWIIVEFDTCFF